MISWKILSISPCALHFNAVDRHRLVVACSHWLYRRVPITDMAIVNFRGESLFFPCPRMGYAESTSYNGASEKRPCGSRKTLKFFACPSGAASTQYSSCALRKFFLSARAFLDPSSKSIMLAIPGPPSFSYLAPGGVPVAWHRSSCGSRIHQFRPEESLRSNRSTMST